MSIETKRLGTLRPQGDIVAAAIPELRNRLRAMVSDGVRELSLDFGEVRMVDSAGIGLIVASHNSLSKLGGKVMVINASADIVELLMTMRIHQHIAVEGR